MDKKIMDMNTAIILAGGQSSRMGFDKQFLQWDGSLLVDRIAEKLMECFEEIIIVANKPAAFEHERCRTSADILNDFGPLGGIHAGLAASNSRMNYIIACDMPYVNVEYIKYMKSLIELNQDAEAIITRFGNWLEPFNAFYSKTLVPVIEEQYAKTERKIGEMLQKSNTLYIDELKARVFSPEWDMFININTQQEYEKYTKSQRK